MTNEGKIFVTSFMNWLLVKYVPVSSTETLVCSVDSSSWADALSAGPVVTSSAADRVVSLSVLASAPELSEFASTLS